MKTTQSLARAALTVLILVCAHPAPAPAASTSAGAALQIAHPETDSAQVVRGVRRESVNQESFSAGPGEILEVVLADGSSVTLASGASVTIESFQYDHATRLGELVVRVNAGLVRIVGGVLNNTSAIHAITPQGEARIDNGIATLDVHDGSTDVALLLGKRIALSANGRESSIDQAPTAVRFTTEGFEPARPLADAQQQSYLALLNPGLISGVAPRFVADDTAEDDATSSERIFAAVATAKDADIDANVQESIPPNDGGPPPDDSGPPVPAPTPLPDVVLNLPQPNVGGLGGLQWSNTTTAIDPLAGAGGDSDESVFYWFMQDRGDSQPSLTSRNTTSVLYGQNASGSLTAGPDEIKRNADVAWEGDPFAQPGFACDPHCGYAFIQDRVGSSRPGAAEDLEENYIAITAPNADYSPTSVPTYQPAEINFLFRMTFDDLWSLPAANAIRFQRDNDFTALVDHTVFPTPATDSYLLLSGFASAAFEVKYESSVPQGGCGSLVTGSGANAGCYTIHGENGADNPCLAAADRSACESAAIDLAHNWVVDNSSFNDETKFADGSVRTYGSSDDDDDTDPDEVLTLTVGAHPLETLHTVLQDPSNNFLMFEATGTGDDARRFMYATGRVLRNAAATSDMTLDTFLLSPGLRFFADAVLQAAPPDDDSQSDEATTAFKAALDDCSLRGRCALSARAFFRPSTVPTPLTGKLYDSGLLVLNPKTSDSSAVFHADFGLSGSGPDQVSTVGVLFGKLDYANATKTAGLSGTLLGSTYGPGTNDPKRGFTSLSAPIVSTAAGGGNALLSATGGQTRVGYAVLETGDAVTAADLGKETPIHSDDDPVRFSSTRLATAVGSQGVASSSRIDAAATTNGYLAGLQIADTSGAVSRMSDLGTDFGTTPNFELAIDPTTNAVHAKVTGWSGTGIGGNSVLSAYIDNNRFGAAEGSSAAIVSGRSVLPGWAYESAGMPAQDPVTSSSALKDKLNGYQYLQWGFFFGDSSPARNAGSYAHLASWVTGNLTKSDAPKPTLTATYEGHLLGNVASTANGVTSVYTTLGTFQNTWDFGIRQGNVSIQFDGVQDYSGKTIFRGDQLNTQKTAYEGSNNSTFVGSFNSNSTSRSGVLNGNFIDNPKTSATHVGVIGRFDIGSPDGGYVASGTFGAEKKP